MGWENCSDAKIMELHTHTPSHTDLYTHTHAVKMDGQTLSHAPTDSLTQNRPITQLSANVLAAIDLFSAPRTAL